MQAPSLSGAAAAGAHPSTEAAAFFFSCTGAHGVLAAAAAAAVAPAALPALPAAAARPLKAIFLATRLLLLLHSSG